MAYAFLVLAFLFLVDQLWWNIAPSSMFGSYFAFAGSLAILVIERMLRHKLSVHESRQEDYSEVDALFVEAQTVEPRLVSPEKPENYAEKQKQLQGEVERLRKLGPRGWTEYELLSLNQMLLDYLKVDDLKARARLSLADLEDYAADSAYRYDHEHFEHWKNRIDEAIKNIEDNEDDLAGKDDAAEPLRAELRTLLEHLASYQANWAEGKSILRGLMTVCAVAIPMLLGMGLLPVFHPAAGATALGLLNWGLLGIVGSLVPVLRGFRTSDLVEVGNTDGSKEVWRAILGAALGLLAGVLVYSMIAAKVIATGLIIPDLTSTRLEDVGRSVLLAIGSGTAFERIFDRVRTTAEGQVE